MQCQSGLPILPKILTSLRKCRSLVFKILGCCLYHDLLELAELPTLENRMYLKLSTLYKIYHSHFNFPLVLYSHNYCARGRHSLPNSLQQPSARTIMPITILSFQELSGLESTANLDTHWDYKLLKKTIYMYHCSLSNYYRVHLQLYYRSPN